MKKFQQEEFNKLLEQYKALSKHLSEKEKERIKLYESLFNGTVTITSDKINAIQDLSKTIDNIRQKMKEIDNQILMFEENDKRTLSTEK